MKKKTFTNEQIGYALRQAEAGKTVAEICRELGVSQQTFYRWRRKSRGMGVAELNRLKELERENKRLGAARPRPISGQAHADAQKFLRLR